MKFDPKKKVHNSLQPKSVDVSVITVNYNGYEDTCEMIESLRELIHSVAYEIIVIDNASKVDEAALLRKKYPFIHTVRSTRNRGFAGGNNLGASIANGKYLFFLNNDTFVKEDNFYDLIQRMESDETIGGISPMLMYADDDRMIQYAGFTPLSRFTLRNRGIGSGEYLNERYLSPKEVPYMHGAAMFVRSDVYREVGQMPEMYFLYYEELDWSLSIRNHGYKLWYDPCCRIFHKESRSTGFDSPLKVFYLTRNRFLFAFRNRTFVERCICHLYMFLGVVPRDCVKYLWHHKKDLVRATLKGVKAYFRMTRKQKLDDYGFEYSYYLS